MKLTDSVVRSFRVSKLFRENTERINNVDFSTNGETLISSSEDDSIVIYDCQNGTCVDFLYLSSSLYPYIVSYNREFCDICTCI